MWVASGGLYLFQLHNTQYRISHFSILGGVGMEPVFKHDGLLVPIYQFYGSTRIKPFLTQFKRERRIAKVGFKQKTSLALSR